MDSSIQNSLQALPKVDTVLAVDTVQRLAERYSRAAVVGAIRSELERIRTDILSNGQESRPFSMEQFIADVESQLEGVRRCNMRRVINATGIALHTNLGRAPLAPEAIRAIEETASAYSNLELNLTTGKRGSRYDHVRDRLCRLTGAEDALVVNNNAAAVTLVVNTLAKDGEVVTSRGELIEIGGSFRMPEVIETTEADLVEVGTTNKTRASDYEAVITERTRILLKVHPSNYRIVGFTETASRADLVALAHDRGLISVEDLGSGALVRLADWDLPNEPTVQEAIQDGVHVVTFSADKLLGGPQAGIIVGKREHVAAMRKNPLLRALRIDKLSLAALEATLILYENEDRLHERLPLLGMLTAPIAALEARAKRICADIPGSETLQTDIAPGTAYVGGGTLPEEGIPSITLRIRSERMSDTEILAHLRASDPPIVARIEHGAVVLDMRTLLDDDVAAIGATLHSIRA